MDTGTWDESTTASFRRGLARARGPGYRPSSKEWISPGWALFWSFLLPVLMTATVAVISNFML
jgi:hypothetical protein